MNVRFHGVLDSLFSGRTASTEFSSVVMTDNKFIPAEENVWSAFGLSVC
jgi:hypothetical protein